MFWSIFLLLVLIACSFSVSGSETALFALSREDRRRFAKSGSRLRTTADALMCRPRRVLMTVLIANTAINVCIFAVSYITFDRLADRWPLAAAVGGLATLIAVILFGEILPKALALSQASRIAPYSAALIKTMELVSMPLIAVLSVLVVEPLTRLLAPPRTDPEVTTEDLESLVELSAAEGVISLREQDMLQAVVSMPEVRVRAVMVPRVDITHANLENTVEEVQALFRESGFKKLPVCGQDLDDVRGLICARDAFLQPEKPLASLLEPVRYVPESINLMQLIRHFKVTGSQSAIVVDEHGGMAGLVTLQDVFEEIVGDLERADKADDAPAVKQLDERTFIVPGALSVRPWRRLLGMSKVVAQADTIGGALVATLGRVPRAGDTVQLGNLDLTVREMDGRRVQRVLIRIRNHDEDAGGEARR